MKMSRPDLQHTIVKAYQEVYKLYDYVKGISET